MFDKLFKALNDAAQPKKTPDGPTAPVKGGKVLKTYEDMIRKGERPPAILVNQVGDMFRDLRRFEQAAEKYVESASLYVREEAWTPALQMTRKAERTLESASLDLPEIRIQIGIIAVQVELGRGEWLDAAGAIEAVGRELQPSNAQAIEQLVEAVDAEPMADPEVEVALGEVLVALGRPEIAIQRYQEALRRANRLGRQKLATDLQAKLAQAEAYEPPARRRLRRSGPQPIEPPATPLQPAEPPSTHTPAPQAATPDAAAPAAGEPTSAAELLLPAHRKEEPSMPALPSLDSIVLDEPTKPAVTSHPTDVPAPPASPPLESDDSPIVLPALPSFDEPAGPASPAQEPRPAAEPAAPSAPAPSAPPPAEPAREPAGIELPELPLRLIEDDEDDSLASEPLSEPHTEELPVFIAEDGEDLPVDVQAPATDDFVQLDELRRKQAAPADTRFVGTDARANADTDEAQVRDLVRQLRQGIRETVPTEEADTHYELGLSFLQMGLFDDAVESFQIAFRAPDLRRRAIEGLAEALLSRGDALLAHRAVRTAREELDEPGQDSIGLLYWQARAAEALERNDEALDLYAQVCLADVRFADAHSRLSELSKQG